MWYFGNTNTSAANNPTTVYTTPGLYTVSLVVFGPTGQKDSTTQTITVVDNPIANFSVSQVTGCALDNSFIFTNSSSNAVSYIWDFGDGTSSVDANPTHTFINAGIYNVKLIATSTYGCQDIEIKNSLQKIMNLKPKNFKWKISNTRSDGFYAHEVTDICPDAVTGEYNEVDKDNNPVYQQVDYSKLVPLLTASIQELKKELDELKNKK